MDNIRKRLADLKGINTNDPVMQSRVVKVLEAIVEELDKKKDECTEEDSKSHKHFPHCGCVT